LCPATSSRYVPLAGSLSDFAGTCIGHVLINAEDTGAKVYRKKVVPARGIVLRVMGRVLHQLPFIDAAK
jgi:hypothetical protein